AVSTEGHQPLHTLTGGDDYIRAFLQIVNVHHHCWCKGIRHGVWTPDDLTYLRAQDGSVQGMLHDWDVLVDGSGEERFPATLPSPNFVPFMAFGLLTPEGLKGDVAVLYRHELESFIWVLIWAVCCYYNGTMIRSAPDGIFGWDGRKPLLCGSLKHAFILRNEAIKPASDGWVYGANLAQRLVYYLDDADYQRRRQFRRDRSLPRPTGDQEKDDPEGVWNEFWTYLGTIRRLVPCVAEFMPEDLRKAADADHLKQSTT
ncbi:hypothetical protein FKP32DRAFT_1569760, partial [Trametes sanguinea]